MNKFWNLSTLAALGLGTLLGCSGGGDESATPAAQSDASDVAKIAPIELKEPTNNEPGFLTAFADADEVVGGVPHTVKLGVDVVDGTGSPPFKYRWDFGDATEFSDDKSTTHVYKIPGSFRASVIVTDSKGDTDQDYVDITVNEDFDYAVTPDQLREAIPLEKMVEKMQKEGQNAKGAAAPGAPAGQAPAGQPQQ
jgi:PKD repeat protein